ncbi:MAG: MlaE family ABC transporter permease [Bradymonadia bacterium]
MNSTLRTHLDQLVRILAAMRRPVVVTQDARQRDWDAVARLGVGSTFFIIVTLAFVGAIMMLHGGYQAGRIVGDPGLVGPQVIPLFVRQLGPTLTGLMIATRVGTGIAARIGSMVVTEQVDALRLSNACPVHFLVRPPLKACFWMLPVLTVLGIAAAFGSGLVTAYVVFDTAPGTYADWSFVSALDAVEAMLKASAYGIAIPLIAGACGLATWGGSAGVGRATTNAVVACSLAVIILDFCIGACVLVLR